MSAQTADAMPDEALAMETPRAPSGVFLVAIAFGLMVLAAIAAALLVGMGGTADGREVMTRVLGESELPFGLQLTSATKMSSSGTLVVYEIPGTPPDAPVAPPPPLVEGATPEPVDWTKVLIPEASGPPRQAAFLFVPSARGSQVLDDMIRSVQGRDRGQLGREGGTVLLDRGRLDFRGWNSDWIHMRTYEPGGTFRDAMRISLSTPEEPCVLTATWSRGVPASKQVLEELVAPFTRPR